MTISFHCEHCGRKIEAQDSAGGKWGKCPACHNRIYVPAPEPEEQLKVAPIDEEEEKRKEQLMAETYKITQDILKEKRVPEGLSAASQLPQLNDEELRQKIVNYLRQMADGKLDNVEPLAKEIAASGKQSLDILDEIALSDMPESKLSDIPQQVLSGLIKNIRERINRFSQEQ